MSDLDIKLYIRAEKEIEYNISNIKLVVCESIGDGSCFFHSLLFAISKRDYILSNSKEEYAMSLRNAVADYYIQPVKEYNIERLRMELEKQDITLEGSYSDGIISRDGKKTKLVSKWKDLTSHSRLIQDVEFMAFCSNMKLSGINFDAGRTISKLRKLHSFADDVLISRTIKYLNISLLILERRKKKLIANIYNIDPENDKYIVVYKTGAHYQAVFPKIGKYYYDFLTKEQALSIERELR